jgi:hypothetical protein
MGRFLLLALCAFSLTTPAAARDMGLAITAFGYGPWDGADECPEGYALGARDVLMRTAPPALRADLEAMEKRVGTSAAYVTRVLSERRGPNGSDVCRNPTLVSDPPLPISRATMSEGFDLDGGDYDRHCPHEEFTSPTGQPGIDNQVRRLTACMRFVRDGRINERIGIDIQSGAAVTLLRITGVDSLENDERVTVEVYKGRDPFVKDGEGRPLPDATMRADGNAPAFMAATSGRIAGGVLETDPVDTRIMQLPAEYLIRDARFRIKLAADGSAEGLLGGYFDRDSFWDSWTRNPAGQQYYTCPSLYRALGDLADGHKDPATGRCTSLSVAFTIKAVRAFVVPPPRHPS